MPEGTLKALAEHDELGAILPADGGDCEEVLAQFAEGRHRHRRPGRPASGRRRQVVRKVVERTDERDRVQERCARASQHSSLSEAGGFVMNVLVVDVGGTHVKILATGQNEPRKFPSGPTLTAETDGLRSPEARQGLEV